MKSNRPLPHIKKDITGNPYIDQMGVWVCSFNGACARGDSPPQAYAKCVRVWCDNKVRQLLTIDYRNNLALDN